MTRVWHVARREWREQLRQPALIGVMAALHGIVAALVLAALVSIETLIGSDPSGIVAAYFDDPSRVADWLEGLAGSTLSLFVFLSFSQFLGLSSVLAGHSVLHDRQVGTLTFLLLAPVRRWELLLGKVLGAVGLAMALHLVIDGTTALLATRLTVAAAHEVWLPLHAAWWWAFLVTGPAWALFVAAVCVLVSTQARDVRLAQQGVWFVVFFATLFAGVLLTWSLAEGWGAQMVAAGLGLFGLTAMLWLGSMLFERDVSG